MTASRAFPSFSLIAQMGRCLQCATIENAAPGGFRPFAAGARRIRAMQKIEPFKWEMRDSNACLLLDAPSAGELAEC